LEITPRQDQTIRDFLCRCFPWDTAVFSKTRYWHNCAVAWSVLLEKETRLIAHLAVIERRIRVNGKMFKAAGVGNVGVDPDCRGKKLSEKILRAAMAEARNQNYDLGLLFCGKSLLPIYERAGWITVHPPRLFYSAPQGEQEILLHPADDKFLMIYPLHAPSLPPGPVDLAGIDW